MGRLGKCAECFWYKRETFCKTEKADQRFYLDLLLLEATSRGFREANILALNQVVT